MDRRGASGTRRGRGTGDGVLTQDTTTLTDLVPATGRLLTLPEGPIFELQRASAADYEIGAFRSWAGYKDLGSDRATHGLALFQQVLSFGPSEESGRTGIHCHLAEVHIVIPTSGRGVFSYDGVVTEAVPGSVIVQHGGTVHDQFAYSYAANSAAENRATGVSLDPTPSGAAQSFGFLELFVPRTIANVEIVPPERVTAADQASAWDHPYHPTGALYALQAASDAEAGYHPLAGHPGLEVRDAGTWAPSGRLVATWILRPASGGSQSSDPNTCAIAGETSGIDILFLAAGRARFRRPGGDEFVLEAGDCLTCSSGLAGDLLSLSPDARLLRLFISSRAEQLRERTPAEIERLEALGADIVTHREVRPEGDRRAVNFLHEAGGKKR
jgi:hypothetical protein